MIRRQLTARGVKTRLTRAGIDHTALTITDKAQTARQVDINFSGPWQRRNVVLIHGTKEQRRPAFHALFDAGLACAPYPDHDEWML